jgi:hypothetical protein
MNNQNREIERYDQRRIKGLRSSRSRAGIRCGEKEARLGSLELASGVVEGQKD